MPQPKGEITARTQLLRQLDLDRGLDPRVARALDDWAPGWRDDQRRILWMEQAQTVDDWTRKHRRRPEHGEPGAEGLRAWLDDVDRSELDARQRRRLAGVLGWLSTTASPAHAPAWTAAGIVLDIAGDLAHPDDLRVGRWQIQQHQAALPHQVGPTTTPPTSPLRRDRAAALAAIALHLARWGVTPAVNSRGGALAATGGQPGANPWLVWLLQNAPAGQPRPDWAAQVSAYRNWVDGHDGRAPSRRGATAVERQRANWAARARRAIARGELDETTRAMVKSALGGVRA